MNTLLEQSEGLKLRIKTLRKYILTFDHTREELERLIAMYDEHKYLLNQIKAELKDAQ